MPRINLKTMKVPNQFLMLDEGTPHVKEILPRKKAASSTRIGHGRKHAEESVRLRAARGQLTPRKCGV